MPNRPRTAAQNKAIHSLLNKFNFDTDSKAEMVADITGGRTESTKEMFFDEANVMIARLGGSAFSNAGQPAARPRRTENYHRQKTGVEQIATATHIDLMRSRARARGMTEDGLGDLSARVNRGVRQPRTSKEVSRVIEAIKAMAKRDNALNSFSKDKKEVA